MHVNFDQILPDLYVGSYPATTDDIEELKTEGITAVVNLQSDDDCWHLQIDWPRLEAHYADVGMEVRRVKIQDFQDDDLRAKLPHAVNQLHGLIENGHTAYVHCSAGINRSPSTVICYLHWMKDWELDDAQIHVCSSRSCDPVMEVIRLATQDRS
jgi:protein-tyrosine phosphatase